MMGRTKTKYGMQEEFDLLFSITADCFVDAEEIKCKLLKVLQLEKVTIGVCRTIKKE